MGRTAPPRTPPPTRATRCFQPFLQSAAHWTEVGRCRQDVARLDPQLGALIAEGRPYSGFGESVAVLPGVCLVGSPNRHVAPENAGYSGRAFIFEEQADGGWTQTAELSQAREDNLGVDMSLGEDGAVDLLGAAVRRGRGFCGRWGVRGGKSSSSAASLL